VGALRLLGRGLGALLRPGFLVILPLVAFIGVVGVVLALRGGAGSSASTAVTTPEPTPVLAVATTAPVALAATHAPTAAPTAVPTATPVPLADRADCAEIAGTAYYSAAERSWYLENCVTVTETISVTPQEAAPPPAGLGDRLVIQRLSIDAPVNYRFVEADGVLQNPSGAFDVVWYDFSGFRGLGGYPGLGGNAVFAGHVDYYSVGAAVFYQLRNILEGDVIEYYNSKGEYFRYVVDWVSDVSPDYNWASLVAAQRGTETMTLITCNGQFDYSAREYSHRRVVRAHREI
jgi:LPXTG-site transpeptidase (sortase) family protein